MPHFLSNVSVHGIDFPMLLNRTNNEFRMVNLVGTLGTMCNESGELSAARIKMSLSPRSSLEQYSQKCGWCWMAWSMSTLYRFGCQSLNSQLSVDARFRWDRIGLQACALPSCCRPEPQGMCERHPTWCPCQNIHSPLQVQMRFGHCFSFPAGQASHSLATYEGMLSAAFDNKSYIGLKYLWYHRPFQIFIQEGEHKEGFVVSMFGKT